MTFFQMKNQISKNSKDYFFSFIFILILILIYPNLLAANNNEKIPTQSSENFSISPGNIDQLLESKKQLENNQDNSFLKNNCNNPGEIIFSVDKTNMLNYTNKPQDPNLSFTPSKINYSVLFNNEELSEIEAQKYNE
jgi:hypothetical protein